MAQDVYGADAPGGISNGPPASSSPATSATDVKETAKDVASTAKDKTADVTAEAKRQARNFTQEAKSTVDSRAVEQRDRAVGGLRSLSDELDRMASGTQFPTEGTASEVVRQISTKARSFSDFLEQREPGEILNEVRSFARQRPALFLTVCGAAGVLAGRLTRSVVAEAKDDGGSSTSDATPTYSAGIADTGLSSGLAGGTTNGFEADQDLDDITPPAHMAAPGAMAPTAGTPLSGTSGSALGSTTLGSDGDIVDLPDESLRGPGSVR